ncbi:MAG TPA: response regulator transcription factor [Terriglobia bacterium]|nr:response regulator transcription factor [Terriglobia bacterium]
MQLVFADVLEGKASPGRLDEAMLNGLHIVIADDHKAMLQRVKGLLNSQSAMVEAVDNGQALVDLARELKPDVVIVDIEMPGMNGIEAVRLIRKSGSAAKVVFLTVHEDPDMVPLCLEAGALAFVVKSRLASDLIPAIQLALTNHTFVSPTLPWPST